MIHYRIYPISGVMLGFEYDFDHNWLSINIFFLRIILFFRNNNFAH